MISADLRFEGFDARSWTNLVSLFAPTVTGRLSKESWSEDAPEAEEADAAEVRRGALVIVAGEDRVLSAFHTERGRIRGMVCDGPNELSRLCDAYAARRAIWLRAGAVEEIGERIARRVERDDDYITQILTAFRVLREVREQGLLATWPTPRPIPIPTAGMVRSALDLILPDDRSLVAVLWHRGQPWTGLVLRRREGSIDLLAGPDNIARWTGPLGGDWRRDYRVIGDAVSRVVAPVHLGVFAEAHTMRGLLRSSDPGAWSRAVAVRDVILSPAPPYAAVALGADTLRAVAQETARVLGGIDALGAFSPLATYVRSRVREVASVNQTLGFDPLQALASWLQRAEEAEEADREAEEQERRRASQIPPPIDDEAS